jgi:RNA polymerase subunit RPABC4/transcription elongation factor Spt4
MSVTWGSMNSVSLSRARLCSNCEQISDARGETCPACGAFANWLSLANLLGASREKTEIEAIRVKGAAA